MHFRFHHRAFHFAWLLLASVCTARNNKSQMSQTTSRKSSVKMESAFIRDVVQPTNANAGKNDPLKGNAKGFADYLMETARPLDEYKAELIASGGRILGPNDMKSPDGSLPDFMHINIDKGRNNHRVLGGDDDEEDDGDDQANVYTYYMNDDAMYDFDGYSFIYSQCQPVQRFSEKAALGGEYSPLITDEIVVFRFCPQRRCNPDTSYGCLSGYGEYVISLTNYLRAKLYYEYDKRTNMCNFCEGCGYNNRRKLEYHGRRLADDYYGADDGGDAGYNDAYVDDGTDDYYGVNDDVDDYAGDDGGNSYVTNDDTDYCSTYADVCSKNAGKCGGNDDDESYDYLDYLDFVTCNKVEKDDKRFYFRPHCDVYKDTIYMGAFYDPYCSQYVGSDVKTSDYFDDGFQKNIFQSMNGKECISCAPSNDPPYFNANGNFCNRLYDDSAKCNTYLAYSIDDDDGGSDSDVSCSFVESVRYGTYDSEGQIAINASGRSQPGEVTPGQVFSLVMLTLVITGLSLYSCFLHHSITNFLLTKLTYQGALLPGNMKLRSSRRSVKKDKGSVSGRSSQSHGSSRRKQREAMEIA